MDRYRFSLEVILKTLFIIAPGPSMAGVKKCNDCPNYGGLLTCDPQTCDWLLLNQYWAGNLTDGGELLISYCPIGYCLNNESDRFVWIPRDSIQTMDSFLCNGSHRMGTMCGLCQPGYAPAINSDTNSCVPCDAKSSTFNWIYYLLGVYAPLLIVLLVIIVFNIRLVTGPLNSFILFAQVISTTANISLAPLNLVYRSGTRYFKNGYEIPYNFFNLNLFGSFLPPFCLHSHLVTLDVIALRYVEAFFPVMIIVVIVLLIKCPRCLKIGGAKCLSIFQHYRIGSSMVHAFAAFVLLSYNRLCEITSYLLSNVSLVDHTLYTVESRIYFQGSYSSDDASYTLRYKLPAYLMMTALALVSIALLHYPVKWLERLVSKVSCLRKVYPTASVVILLDTFQGCFKDNRRYFAGLYLALRLLLFIAYILPLFLQFLVQQILYVAYILLLAILRPYKEKYLNYLDVCIFVNLALINIFTWFTTNQVLSEETLNVQICIVIESILVFLPMVYFVTYLLWYITRRYHEGTKMKLKELYRLARERFQRGTKTQDNRLEHPNTAPYLPVDDILMLQKM